MKDLLESFPEPKPRPLRGHFTETHDW
jgi:hypothetical protein